MFIYTWIVYHVYTETAERKSDCAATGAMGAAMREALGADFMNMNYSYNLYEFIQNVWFHTDCMKSYNLYD